MKTFSLFKMAVLVLFLSGCTTSLNHFKPFSEYVGQEVTLKRPCVLEEYIANNAGLLYTFWENGQPTNLVYDDRMWAKSAKIIVNDYQQEQKLYLASNYNKRIYCLSESEIWTGVNRKNYGGPYRVHHLPAGTKIFIENVNNFNGIDSISKSAQGHMTIPGTFTKVNFRYGFRDGPSAHGTMSDYISRAPWEDESVPEELFVGLTGTEYGKSSGAKR